MNRFRESLSRNYVSGNFAACTRVSKLRLLVTSRVRGGGKDKRRMEGDGDIRRRYILRLVSVHACTRTCAHTLVSDRVSVRERERERNGKKKQKKGSEGRGKEEMSL